jgi:hypothetical protein
MRFVKLLQRELRRRDGGVDLAVDVNAVVAANVESPSRVVRNAQSAGKTRQEGDEKREATP